ncbi:SH3 domain-containing protein [Butyrivibrio sp. AE2032]|uniref:SH3 domain-containing protein n=1 Tax=Butyrivibrio sp. AE2032 TaxID=1458463 RepID=UPI00054D7625|nr:SH3 domain-containing protein [Butyrivibrio sp. AE2032]
MSKTVATCIAETNLVQGEPQENVFFLTLSRKIEDFPNEFLRTARSTSPIQICAIFSTIGPDNLSAVLNLELNAELEKIAAACSNQAVLDFEGFANQVINNLNVKVCNFAANKGTQFKTSMSMFVIEGDILRVIHVGITKAVLFRNNRIMLLTEEQTVAHRYVQMGAIQPGEELTHPENMNLTQYLGKMPQEGPVNADKKVHLKLQDNDELFLMGVGLSRKLPSQMRNSIIAKPLTTEVKAKEIINAAVSYGLKSGLTLIDIKVESTFLLPGDAVINSNLKTEAPVAQRPGNAAKTQNASDFTNLEKEESADDTINYVPGSATAAVAGMSDPEEEEPIVNEKKEKIKTIIIPIVIFIVCVLLGFGVTFMVFNMKDLISFTEATTFLPTSAGSVLYAASDGVPVYSQASLDSTVIGNLNRGDVVTLQEITDSTFSKVITANNVTGYVLSAQLLEEDPTYFDETTEMTGDPTPIPTTETAESTTQMTTTAVQTDQIWSTTKATTTSSESSDSSATVEPPDDVTPTPNPDGGNGGGDNGGGDNGGGDNGGGDNGGGDNGGGDNGGGDNGGGDNGGGDNGGGDNGGGDNGGGDNGGGDNGGSNGGDAGGGDAGGGDAGAGE